MNNANSLLSLSSSFVSSLPSLSSSRYPPPNSPLASSSQSFLVKILEACEAKARQAAHRKRLHFLSFCNFFCCLGGQLSFFLSLFLSLSLALSLSFSLSLLLSLFLSLSFPLHQKQMQGGHFTFLKAYAVESNLWGEKRFQRLSI